MLELALEHGQTYVDCWVIRAVLPQGVCKWRKGKEVRVYAKIVITLMRKL
jgi:hypothetical protein